MTLTITPEQRDALYDQILIHLSGIGDVWLAAEAQNFETANRLGREYCDELHLILDDLGWGDGPNQTITLTTPPDVLRRVFTRLADTAEGQGAIERRERAEAEQAEAHNRLVAETCRLVLAELDREQRR
ncbi:MAG: hypothetical protein WD810_01545 [Solirubrobacterales bacterium]